MHYKTTSKFQNFKNANKVDCIELARCHYPLTLVNIPVIELCERAGPNVVEIMPLL